MPLDRNSAKGSGKAWITGMGALTCVGGDRENIVSLAAKSFKVPAGEQPDLHTTRLILVDEKARIRGYYDSEDFDSLRKLEDDINTLLEVSGLSHAKGGDAADKNQKG